jgi:uncharacterized membrane protein
VSAEKSRKKIIPDVLLKFPTDLMLVAGWLVLGVMTILLPLPEITPLRVVLALPLMLFIPGYCVIAAFFPRYGDIDLIERCVLSFGSSMVIVPLIGLGLNFTPWGIHLEPLVISITLFTLIGILAAHHTRAQVPYEEQFRISFTTILDPVTTLFKKSDGHDRIPGIILALLILIAIITAGYVISVPREGEPFTELFILGSNHTAADYPDRMIPGQNYPVYIGVRNHEYRDTRYTIEIWMLHTEYDNMTNSSRITAMVPQDRVLFPLAHNQTLVIPYNLSVNSTGYNRFEFLLFDENVPGFEVAGSNRINASYRNLHLLFRIIDAPEVVVTPEQPVRNPPRSTRP